MTRDHDMKRAIRARMQVTGESYTVARAALVAPTIPATESKASESQGGTMASVQTTLLDELNERGFTIIRGLATPEQLAGLTALIDGVVEELSTANLEDNRTRVAAGGRAIGATDAWFAAVSDRPEVAWVLRDRRLLDIAAAAKGSDSALRKAVAIVSLPGCGHEGLHQEHDGTDAALGSWDSLVFVVMLSTNRAGAGAIRAVPGSHRSAEPPFPDAANSAYAPHDEEVHIEGEPGDVLVCSGHLWKSGTFNGGREPAKLLALAGADDVDWPA